jgi:hypothetical protein
MNVVVFFIENIVFWTFVYVIVFMGCETPSIIFTGFGFFLFYWIFRFIFRQAGSDRIIWIYVLNMFFTLLLLYYFITGTTLNKSVRSFLNNISRQTPSLEPYLKKC